MSLSDFTVENEAFTESDRCWGGSYHEWLLRYWKVCENE